MDLLLPTVTLNGLLPLLAVIASVFVITTKNAIISVFNLIVLYILVAFYLIYIGIIYIGISYIIIYIGAIAILFLFIIMIIDIEVVEKRSNNYLPLLFLLLSGFLIMLKKIIYKIGLIKVKTLSIEEEIFDKSMLFNTSESLKRERVLDVIGRDLNNKFKFGKVESIINDDQCERGFDKVRAITELNDNLNRKSVYNLAVSMKDISNANRENNDRINTSFSLSKIVGEEYNQIPSIKDININFKYNNEDFLSLDLIKYKYISSVKTKNKECILDTLNGNIYSKNIDNKNYSDSFGLYLTVSDLSKSLYPISEKEMRYSYLMITPDWDLATNRITQISAIGDVLYTVYHSYIYILSVILLLGMVGAIILTADNCQEVKVTSITRNKYNSVLFNFYLIKKWKWYISQLKDLLYKLNNSSYYFSNNLIKIFNSYKQNKRWVSFIYLQFNSKVVRNNNNKVFSLYKYNNGLGYDIVINKSITIPSFFYILNRDDIYYEGVMGNLAYFVSANIIIALLLLIVNSYFSLSVKYLEKGGGFECGFTSFIQTRERFNVIFYRVSLLFLIFDLEIILIFPYTVIYQKNQNISKNNVIAFLYILIVGFIFELKEGALNIVKKTHSTKINNNI